MSRKSTLGSAAVIFTTPEAQADATGLEALLEDPTAYEIFLGPDIGPSYAATGFAFAIGDADHDGSTLIVT